MIISGENLSKSYGSTKALENVDITCNKGEIIGLLGSNGAGKTTLLKILLGLITPDSGEVKIFTEGQKPLGGIIEKPALYEYLNCFDNLKYFSGIQNGKTNNTFIESQLQRVGLPLNRKDAVRNFSMGMKQRLGIAIALLNNPKLLILDEPFSGLDPLGIAALRQMITDLVKKENITVIISSHIIEELSRVSQYLYVMSSGRIVRKGSTHEIIHDCTYNYIISGPEMGKNAVDLIPNAHIIDQNQIKVAVTSKDIPSLLGRLQANNKLVTSCTPEIDMNALFQTPETC